MSDVPTTPIFPECCCAPKWAPLAQRMYAAYNRGGPADKAGLNYQGLPCPTWEALPDGVRQKWEAAAGEVLDQELLAEAEALEKRIAQAAHDAGRGPVGLALNVAKTQLSLARGMLMIAAQDGAAVGSG